MHAQRGTWKFIFDLTFGHVNAYARRWNLYSRRSKGINAVNKLELSRAHTLHA